MKRVKKLLQSICIFIRRLWGPREQFELDMPPQSLRDLLSRPTSIYQMVRQDRVQGAIFHQLAIALTARREFVLCAPRRLRAVANIALPTARQLTAYRAGGTAKKPGDSALTLPPLMPGKIMPRSRVPR